MKKISFSLLLMLLMAGSLFAQEGFKLGFRVNPMLTFPTVTDSTKGKIEGAEYAIRPGIGFGLMVNYGFSETIGLHTGLHIQARNFKSTQTDILGGVGTVQYSITTLEIPIQLKLRSPEIGSGIYIVGMFGGAAELNVANTRKISYTLAGTTIDDEEKDGANINLLSSSFVPGAGVDWEFDWGTVYMGASYHMGLMNVLRKKENGNINVKMNSVSLDLGYYF